MKTNIIILILCSGRDNGVWLGTVNVCAEEPMVLLARVMTERSRACTKSMKELYAADSRHAEQQLVITSNFTGSIQKQLTGADKALCLQDRQY
jgi:hypothetical protein